MKIYIVSNEYENIFGVKEQTDLQYFKNKEKAIQEKEARPQKIKKGIYKNAHLTGKVYIEEVECIE